jgi:hypothetical protein
MHFCGRLRACMHAVVHGSEWKGEFIGTKRVLVVVVAVEGCVGCGSACLLLSRREYLQQTDVKTW